MYLFQPTWIDWAGLRFPSGIRWLGAAIGAARIVGLVWVHHELGKNFSGTLQIGTDQTLVTSGSYRWIRHPMYTTLYLVVISFFLLSANWLIAAFWIVILTLVVMSRLSKEEAAMQAKFGDQYRDWAARTGRLFPRLR